MAELTGKFDVEITGTALEPQGTRKGPTIVIKFKLLNKLHPDGTKEQMDGDWFRTKWFTLTDKNAQYVAGDLAALGFVGQPSQLDPEAENHFDLTGAHGTFYCKQREYPKHSERV